MSSRSDSPENGDVLVQPPLLNGYLKKLGERGVKSFKKRYFRQTGYKVAYYESENDKLDHSKGAINLEMIQEVRRSSSHSNAFELVSKESKRIYVLQVCQPGETVDQWIGKWNAWLAHLKETWARAQQTIGSGTGRGSVKLTTDLLKLSSFTTVESASGNDLVSSYPEETWPKVLAEADKETDAQLVAITTMRAEVEELNQEYKMMTQAKETAIERVRLALQEEVRVLEKEVTEYQRTLVSVDQQLIHRERGVMKAEKALAASAERVELKEELLKALREQIQTAEKEIEGQTASLQTLRTSVQDNPAFNRPALTATIEADVDRLKRHWAANTEQQLLNDQITRQLRTLESSFDAHEIAQSNATAKLQKGSAAHQAAVDTIRRELAEAQHVELSVVQEFESLRKRYFVSLTLCIKLQGEVTGKKPAIDLSDLDSLHQRALTEKPDHLDWNDWLAETLFPGTPKSHILGRRRASVSQPGSQAVPTR